MKIPLVAGRDFSVADTADSEPVAIVSERASRRFWPGQNPVGQYLPASFGDPGNGALVIAVAHDVTVIGGPQVSPPPDIYRPLMQRYFPRVTIAVRTMDGRRLAGDIRALLSSMNPDIAILKSETLESGIDAAMAPQRNGATVTGSLGIVGLLLASFGVYGISAYAVTRRTREIGIRIALGARRSQVTRLVLGEGMSLVAVGSAIGLLVAYAASRAVRGLPFDVPAADFVTLIGAAALFMVVGLVACWTPMRRATRIDAMAALRHD